MTSLEILLTAFAAWVLICGHTTTDRGALPPRLYLRFQGRFLQGLCRGIAEYYATPLWLVRTFTLALFVVEPFSIWLYLALGIALAWHPADTHGWLRMRAVRWFNRSRGAADGHVG